MKSALKLMVAAMVFGAPLNAQAGLIGVKEITVYSHGNGYVQIAELIATQSGTGIDVALATNGATATSTSNYSTTSNAAKAIDGIFPAAYPNIWHSGSSGAHDFLDVTLAASAELDSVIIWGRAPAGGRDIYDVYLFDSSHNLLSTALGADASIANFVTVNLASTDVPEPTGLAVLGFGILALRRTRRE